MENHGVSNFCAHKVSMDGDWDDVKPHPNLRNILIDYQGQRSPFSRLPSNLNAAKSPIQASHKTLGIQSSAGFGRGSLASIDSRCANPFTQGSAHLTCAKPQACSVTQIDNVAC